MWNGDHIVYETTGTTEQKYYYGATLYAMEDTSGNVYYYGKNIHGDIVELYDEDGEYVRDYRYDAFGNQLNTNTADANPFRYAGEYYDAETGLIYLRNRYYDTRTGRFITEDPIRDGLNWYVYCENNPVMFVDPLGLNSWVIYAANTKSGDGEHTFADESEIWGEKLIEQYGTPVHYIGVSSAGGFRKAWSTIGQNGEEVDAVVLIFHGSADDGINGNGEKGGVGYMYLNDGSRIAAKEDVINNEISDILISDLAPKQMKSLIFSSCNSGNPDIYNVAYAFMLNSEISGNIIAWDGGTIFNYDKERLEAGGPNSHQYTWHKYVKKVLGYPLRTREGKRVLKDV